MPDADVDTADEAEQVDEADVTTSSGDDGVVLEQTLTNTVNPDAEKIIQNPVDDLDKTNVYLDSFEGDESERQEIEQQENRQGYNWNSSSGYDSDYQGPENSNTVASSMLHTHKAMWKALDMLQEQIEENMQQDVSDSVAVTIAKGATWTFSAGIVTWALRAGSLMATAFSSFPLWRWVDPLPILNISEDERKQKEEDIRREEKAEDYLDKKVRDVLDKKQDRQKEPVSA